MAWRGDSQTEGVPPTAGSAFDGTGGLLQLSFANAGALVRTSATARREEDELVAAAREELLARARTQIKRARSERAPEHDRAELADRLLTVEEGEPNFVEKLAHVLHQAGVRLPSVQVEYRDLTVEADALVGQRAVPSMKNAAVDAFKKLTLQGGIATENYTILNGISGMLRPGSITLLLGPPGAGKTVLLQTLAGRLRPGRHVRIRGSMRYNGVEGSELQLHRTVAYVDQYNHHIPQLTVLETCQFSADCQNTLETDAQFALTFQRMAKALAVRKSQRALSEAATDAAEGGGEVGIKADPSSPPSKSPLSTPGLGPADRTVAPSDAAQPAASSGKPTGTPAVGAGTDLLSKGLVDSPEGAPALGKAAGGAGLALPGGLDVDPEFAADLRHMVEQDVKVHLVLRVMGLSHAADTLVGDNLLRGVSGGERKRTTTAEVLCGPQSVLLMDEISTGLDSATTFSAVKSFSEAAKALDRTFLISLLQPPPEVLHLFDDLLLLTDGRVIYHGPMAAALGYFESALGLVCPPRKDAGSFLQEVTTPVGQYAYASPVLLESRGLSEADRESTKLLTQPPEELLTSVEQMNDTFWKTSEWGTAMLQDLQEQPFKAAAGPPGALFTQRFANSRLRLTTLVLRRQVLLNKRSTVYYIARIAQAVIISLITASLFGTIHPTQEEGRKVIALSAFASMTLAMTSSPQVQLVFEHKSVFFKHREMALFPPTAYMLSFLLPQLLESVAETLLFANIIYWACNFTREVGPYFTFLLIIWASSNSMSALFRLLAFSLPSLVVAQAFGGLLMLVLTVTAGFSVVRPAIPAWLIWVFWANPLSWATRAIVANELDTARWSEPVEPGSSQTVGEAAAAPYGVYLGSVWVWTGIAFCWASVAILSWAGVLALTLTQPPKPRPTVSEEAQKEVLRQGVLGKLQRLADQQAQQVHQGLRGTKSIRASLAAAASRLGRIGRSADPSPERCGATLATAAAASAAAAVESGAAAPSEKAAGAEGRGAGSKAAASEAGRNAAATRAGSQAGSLDALAGRGAGGAGRQPLAVEFVPITLVCRNLSYYVDFKGDSPYVVQGCGDPGLQGKLQLLKDINVMAEPGTLTALVGGSGAGKTTLMDVVLGRKTVGLVRGDIFVNGHLKEQATWSRVCGYVEQNDVHSAGTTVREALVFSARLRLTEDITLPQIEALVEETLRMVDLTALQHSIVGEPGGVGLSIEQRKRLSIGVELVANPSVVFMDEPTSGLDARAAAIVMRSVKNVSRTNRTVMVTIHQPSQDIFEAFDWLILLQRGGRLTYHGPLGFESRELITYLEALPGVQPIQPGFNPATWMLEVTGGSMSTIYEDAGHDFPAMYAESELRRENEARMDQLVEEGRRTHQPLSLAHRYATSRSTQYRWLMKKYFAVWWRSPSYNFLRLLMTIGVGLLLGLIYMGQGKIDPGGTDVGTVNSIMGMIFTLTAFLGSFNTMTVQPVVGAEREVFYRERAAAMYATGPFALATSVVEVPYLAAQSLLMTLLVYWTVGFGSAAWQWWYFFLTYTLSLTLFTFFGQVMVVVTPSLLLAQLLTGFTSMMWFMFSGFMVPYPSTPAGWKWAVRISPTTYMLWGLVGSQLGGCSTNMSGYGPDPVPVNAFLAEVFDIKLDFVWWCTLIIAAFCLTFIAASAAAMRFLNFQRR